MLHPLPPWSRPPSSQRVLTPSSNPWPLAPFRRRLLLDDLGWVPVMPIDQRPDPGGLGSCGVGGCSRPAAVPSEEQLVRHSRPGSRPHQRAAAPHASRRQLRAGQRIYVIGPRPRPRACAPPSTPPRRVATPFALFKKLVLYLRCPRGGASDDCGGCGVRWGVGSTRGSRGDSGLAKWFCEVGASETGLELCLQSATCV